MLILLALVGGAVGQIVPFESETIFDAQWEAAATFGTTTVGTVGTACTDWTDATVWGAIQGTLDNKSYTECLRGVTHQGVSSSTACFAAYSNDNNAGLACRADYCALGASGEAAGMNCIGYMCAAYTNSGCPPFEGPAYTASNPTHGGVTFALTNNAYTNYCCTERHGSGCVGEKCAYKCESHKCGEFSIGTGSASNCWGSNCGRFCQGTLCADTCQGEACGNQCWGEACARNCSGPNCGMNCMGASCATNCTGNNCGQFCSGASCAAGCVSDACGNNCHGENCAAGCTNGGTDDNACGESSVGSGSANNCVGHGCGAQCVGVGCAYNGSSIYTAGVKVDGFQDETYRHMVCFNEWIGKGMNQDEAAYFVADVLAPTAAPSMSPTAPTFAPTGAPSTTTATTNTITHTHTSITTATTVTSATTVTGARRARRAVNTGAGETEHDNSTCSLTRVASTTANADTVRGPGYACVGHICAANTSGAFAGANCAGDHCATLATGIFAGVACVGSYCAQGAGLATDYAVGSHCYGYGCAQAAVGEWAGSYCIGNACAQGCTGLRCGTCCVGLNCSSNATGLCPGNTDGGVPYNMGSANQLFSDACRQIDTSSSTWTTFFEQCAGNMNSSQLTTLVAPNCLLPCTDHLSNFLRYYHLRLAVGTYASAYESLNVRNSNYVQQGSTDDGLTGAEIALIVLGSVLVLVVGVVSVYGVTKSRACMRGTYEKMEGDLGNLFGNNP
jgi:hypothetical protein